LKDDQYLTSKFDLKQKERYSEKMRQYRKNTYSEREQHKREKEEAMLQIVEMYDSRGGISHNKLANIVHLDRKSLRPYTQNLLKQGLIKREGNKHHGKYIPTRKPSYTDLLLRASLFADYFRLHLLNAAAKPRFAILYEYNGYGSQSLIVDEPPEDYFMKAPEDRDPLEAAMVDFTAYTKYYQPKFTEQDKLECMLFEFSNRIGAFITYAIVQAANLSDNGVLSKREQRQFITDWVHTCISHVIPQLTMFFEDSIYRAGSRHIQNSELNEIFQRLYPYLGYKLRKSISKLPKME
jgi:predicted transcriptional regulator